MVNRKIALFLVLVVSLVVFAGSASAVTQSSYMVDEEFSFNPQPAAGSPAVATYAWDQNPWLYFVSPSSMLTYSVSWWNHTGEALKTPNLEITVGTNNVWHGFSNFDDWAAIRKAGDWTVRADYTYADGSSSGEIVPFRVVPEPVSSALFLLGGSAIAALKLRKRKNT